MTVGLVIMLSIIAISTGFFILPDNSLNQIQLRRIGSDIFASLDYENVLDTFDKAAIEGNISLILPFNTNVSAVIKKFSTNGDLLDQIQINSDIRDKFISGKRVFAGNAATNFYVAEYKVSFR
ncbi:MAG: hypothetical protein HYT72_02400 [Candidatus Aenigmarchaeota archaeon]|nr:hypothetical protein [Candidatus Aenigmarchaeota archaeon]